MVRKLKNCLFGYVKLIKNADPEKYKYTNIAALARDSCSRIFVSRETLWKKCYYLWADMSSLLHIDIKGKDILILGEGPTQELDHTILTAEAILYPINFTFYTTK